MHDMNRNIAIDAGVAMGKRLANDLRSTMAFKCDCNGAAYSVVRPRSCIQEFVNALGNKVGWLSGVAYDGMEAPYAPEDGINNSIAELYRCVEAVSCRKRGL